MSNGITFTELTESVERRLRVLGTAFDKVSAAKRALKEAEETYKDLVGSGYSSLCMKVVESKIRLGKFTVRATFGVSADVETRKVYPSSQVDVQFYKGDDFQCLEELLTEFTHSDLDAYKTLKKTMDDFLAGKIAWPYPYTIRE